MSVYNSAAIAETMNVGVSNVTGTTTENATATEDYKQVVNNGGQYIKNPRDILVNNAVGRTSNGLTVSRNSDGTISIVGTATATASVYFYNFTGSSIPTRVTDADYQKIPIGKYLCGSAPPGSEINKYLLSCRVGSEIGGNTRLLRVQSGEPLMIDNTNGESNYILLYFTVWSGQTVNLIVSPYLKKV